MKYLYELGKKIYYFLLEIVTFGKGVKVTINGIKLKLPSKYYRLFPPVYEKENFDFFNKHIKKGSVILDIGANIGLFSVIFSKLSQGKVYSFEPTPATQKWLRKTIDINNCSESIDIVPVAVSDKAGKANFFTSTTTDISMANSLVDFDLEEVETRESYYEVDLISIDEFVKQKNLKPDILKIDAEGVELEVLKGAAYTFLNYRPHVTLGLHLFAYTNKESTLTEIWNLLVDYKMKVQIDGQDVSKENFCKSNEKLFDVQLIPQ